MSDFNDLPEEDVRKSGDIPDAPQKEFKRPDTHHRSSEIADKGTRAAGMAVGIGFSLAVPPFVAAAIGYWLDERFHTAPYLLMTLFLLGVVAGFVQMIRMLDRMDDAEKKR